MKQRAGAGGTPSSETPLIRQYREIKSQHTDAILFFRMGDFYEMFFDDAELASRELGLTLTSRNNGAAANVPLAGFPVKAVNNYLRRLVERGHRVAICEQVEDPRTAKGIVRRAVIETLTPGAVLSDNLLDENRNNFLVAVNPGDPAGIAALDVSTGEFFLETIAQPDVAAAVDRYTPKEIVVPENAELPGFSHQPMITRRSAWEFDAELGTEDMTRRFRLASLEGLGIEERDAPGVAAAAALLRYAAELQPSGLPQIARPAVLRDGGTMPLDEMTRRNLELVEPLSRGARATDSTLFDLLDTTRTPMGSRLLRQWLLAPLIQLDPIRARHDAVEVLQLDLAGRDRLQDGLAGVRDIERLAGRAAARRASPRDLGALRDSLARLPDVQNALDTVSDRSKSEELQRIAEGFDQLADLHALLADALVDRPPVTLGDSDSVKPGANTELDEVRELRDGGKRFIAGLQVRERERTGIPSLKVGFNRVFGYYIEVTKTHRHAIPADYDRRQTLTNAERFATPELKDYEARVLGAEEQVLALERQLLDALCQEVQDRLDRSHRTARHLAMLDVFASFAESAVANAYVRPIMTHEMALKLERCRHPMVEGLLPPGKFIPNDIHLDEAARVMLLTGPNMAGKSTILRQVGLCVIMAQVGAFVPASAATIGVVDRVFTRVGASDDLGRGQSTFMVEMTEVSAILHGATARSLALLDEIGRGTATYDGVAIAWAVTEHLHGRIGAKTIFATHYHELTQLTEELEHACNYNVAVREVADDIVFLHRLVPGSADRSYGIQVGRLAGLPGSVVDRAREILTLLEAGHHVAGQLAPPASDTGQLALFEPDDPILQELKQLEINEITPIEALGQLAEFKRRAEER
ncbi:MAG: DNA mismatch repair protein MutS [Gemmatimonadetes bacterium]|nr:DNA mismatch repair protein MutS [Gemmatimonadota bacterium]